MADMMSRLKEILGDGAEDKIKNAVDMLKNSGIVEPSKAPGESLSDVSEKINNDIKVTDKPKNTGGGTVSPEGLEIIGQLKNIVDSISNTNDRRSDLLRSLRPFMRSQRQQAIDRAIKIMNISRFSGIFGKGKR